MAENALKKSRDLNELKKFRGAIKGQVTSALNKLEALFTQRIAEDYDHNRIFVSEVNQVESKLKSSLDLFLKLHDRCCEFRDEGADADGEIELLTEDDNYSDEVTGKVYPMYGQIEDYRRSVARFELTKTIPVLERNFEDSYAAYGHTKRKAQQIIQCLDGLTSEEIVEAASVQVQPAERAKEELKQRFEEIVAAANKLKDALIARGDSEDSIAGRLKFDRMEETVKVGDINVDLEKIVTVQKLNSTKNTTSSVLSSTFKEPEASTPIKLTKPEPLKFSGQIRDFASFKNKFETIVVPNRSAVDIGVHLLQAIPAKHQHLVANVKLENHVEMMKILAEEFGTVDRIVDSVVSEMERIKPVNSDKAFVEFVEKIEKMHRDLKTVDMLREIVNASNISKLESKLPTVVSQEWTMTVINEDLTAKGSDTKFSKFMDFLAKFKKMVKYQMSDARSSAGNKTQTQACFTKEENEAVEENEDVEENESQVTSQVME